MAYQIHTGRNWQTDEIAVFVSERVEDRIYYIEPAADGMVSRRLRDDEHPPRPLWRFPSPLAREIFPALVEALAQEGFRAKDPLDASMPVVLAALDDARGVRDRLLTIIEKRG